MVTVRSSQDTDRSDRVLCTFVDYLELLLQFTAGEFLTVDDVGDFEELVLADNRKMLVLLGRVFLGVVSGLGGDTRAVEHVLVRVHRHWDFSQVLWLQRSIIHLAFELKGGKGDSCGTRSGVAATLTVILVGVKVRNIRDNRVSVAQVCTKIPPFDKPVIDLGVVATSNESLLECLSLATGPDELFHGLGCAFVFGGRQQRVYGFQVTLCGFFECWDGEFRERVFESKCPAFGEVLDIACLK